jgi:hypothetical protein
MRSIVLGSALAVCAACASPPGPLARAREAAQELNLNARFGQNDLAMEHVAPTARDDFAARHRAWGAGIRVADVELSGMKPRGDHDVDVLVRVAWYRLEQEELLSTTVKQGWHDDGGWKLVTEERVDGEMGLLGETVVFQAPATARTPAQFPTLRLGQSGE